MGLGLGSGLGLGLRLGLGLGLGLEPHLEGLVGIEAGVREVLDQHEARPLVEQLPRRGEHLVTVRVRIKGYA